MRAHFLAARPMLDFPMCLCCESFLEPLFPVCDVCDYFPGVSIDQILHIFGWWWIVFNWQKRKMMKSGSAWIGDECKLRCEKKWKQKKSTTKKKSKVPFTPTRLRKKAKEKFTKNRVSYISQVQTNRSEKKRKNRQKVVQFHSNLHLAIAKNNTFKESRSSTIENSTTTTTAGKYGSMFKPAGVCPVQYDYPRWFI